VSEHLTDRYIPLREFMAAHKAFVDAQTDEEAEQAALRLSYWRGQMSQGWQHVATVAMGIYRQLEYPIPNV
jgi:hypothetical protein